MIIFEIILLVTLIVCAVFVSISKKLLTTIIIFMAYSLIMSILWVRLQSPDLAMTEAAVGAGITSILFFVVLRKIGAIEDIMEDIEKKERKDEVNPKSHHNPAFDERYNEWMRGWAARYEEWSEEHGISAFRLVHNVLSTIICLSLIGILLVVVAHIPEFGNADNPANNEVVRRYIEQGVRDTGTTNFVAGMLFDYRAFDTLGEIIVLMTAVACVLILLRNDGKKDIRDAMIEEMDEPLHDSILQTVSFLLVPFVIVLGIYVVLNGHLSPGGGFSGGAILGSGFVLYSSAYGAKKTSRFFSYSTLQILMQGGLLFYLLAKGYSFYMGANYLDSGIPLGTPGNLLSAGLVLPLNICVGLVVSCTIYSFFALFGKGEI